MPESHRHAALSKSGISIRLTEERWQHIVEEHTELAERRISVLQAIAEPERIVTGNAGELMALRTQADGKVLVAIYRERGDDGFVITAFLTRRLAALSRRTQIWPSPTSPNS